MTKKLKILIVDDDVPLLRALARILRGHNLYAATSITAAMEQLERQRMDVVLTDYHLEEGDGVMLLEMIRRGHPNARRALMSTDPPPYLKELVFVGVVEHFIPKPFPRALARDLVDFVCGPPQDGEARGADSTRSITTHELS